MAKKMIKKLDKYCHGCIHVRHDYVSGECYHPSRKKAVVLALLGGIPKDCPLDEWENDK